MNVDVQLWSFVVAGLLVIIGLYAIAFMDNLVKKIIGVMLVGDGVNLVLITEGFKPGGIVPIISEKLFSSGAVGDFANDAAYSLPFALVLTKHRHRRFDPGSPLGISIKLYQHYRSLSVAHIFQEDDA
jgi:energy-converting hydrogenase B subunit E